MKYTELYLYVTQDVIFMILKHVNVLVLKIFVFILLVLLGRSGKEVALHTEDSQQKLIYAVLHRNSQPNQSGQLVLAPCALEHVI